MFTCFLTFLFNFVINREKREARLIEEYEECLKFFEKRTFDEGVGRMRKLL